jgi:chorismate mutase
MGDNMLRDAFALVRVEMLPEAIQKTLEAKKLLETGEVAKVQEAVERVGISRSSFYKYKDSVFPFNAMVKEKIVTISLILEHRSGVLSQVLGYLAAAKASVLTIHQTIPLQGEANVSMSVDTTQVMVDINDVLEGLAKLDGVRRAVIVGTGK